jgi:hypothetical protein
MKKRNYEERLTERVAMLREIYKEKVSALSDVPELRGDVQFYAWFMMMLSKFGPDWVTALDGADEGREILRRISGIQSRLMQGVTNAT